MRTSFGSPARTAGYTLPELLVVVVLVGILASLAYPSLDGVTFHTRARAALNRVAGDLYHARMMAVREGTRTVLRFTRRPDAPGCHAPVYTVVVRSTPERVKVTELDLGSGETCLQLGTVDSIVYNSRGLPAGANNRKMYVRRGERADSMTLSLLGRVWKWY